MVTKAPAVTSSAPNRLQRTPAGSVLPPKRNCRDCQQFQLSEQGPRCRFRAGRPSGICSVFKRQQ